MADTVPSALHVHRGTRAVQRMVEHAPATGGLALWVHHADLPDDAPPLARPARSSGGATPPVHTDGHTVFYRKGFDRLPLPEQAGWVAHQVLHIALRHAQRYVDLNERLGDADLELYNVCADAIVNSALDHLGWLQLPANAVRLDRLLSTAVGVRMNAETALLEWDVERLYRAIDDRGPTSSFGRAAERKSERDASTSSGGSGTRDRPSPRNEGTAGDRDDAAPSSGHRPDGPRAQIARALGAEFANDLAPGADSRGAPEDEAEHAREWAERLLRGHAGDGQHSMLRALLADLPRTHTPWEQVLRLQVAHALAQKPGLSWSRPARSYLANQGRVGQRRMPWEPGTTASRAVPKLVVIVDVSGSIDGALMERFAREIEALSRRLEAALVLVIGDDRVRSVSRFEPGTSSLRDVVFHGGGGTDFSPLLEEAQRHRPDIAVVLTDLQGPAVFHPRYPVVWAVPKPAPGLQAPFGRLLPLR